ncbi:MAG: hypothetical protein HY536_02080 [Candidatus Colwellbacteria bacterium]|nr:hypothetical protein [Candidatus Colwellbacteria bacterium]
MEQMRLAQFGLVSLAVSCVGFYLAYLYGRKTTEFRWSEYFAILIVPIMSVIVLALVKSEKILILFLISACLGSLLEYLVGLLYHKVLNKRLWTYHRLSLNGYTSVLSFPVWGIAGVVFWGVGALLGL